MEIINVKELKIPEIKVFQFKKYQDARGFFTEKYKENELFQNDILDFLKKFNISQINEAYSKAEVFRGFHIQANPYMGKLVRCIVGRVIDFALDLRKDSPTFTKVVSYELKSNILDDKSDYIWIPPGFAHAVLFPEDSIIEYYCTGNYNPAGEAGISPAAPEIDWSDCEAEHRDILITRFKEGVILKDRDLNGLTLQQWAESPLSEEFVNLAAKL